MSDITKGAPGGPVSNGTNGRVNGGRPDFDKLETNVIIVGGGFGGIYGMYKFRKLGLKVNLVEAGAAFGGTWFWNRYPGARVDNETPYYSLAIPEVFNSWNFSSRFPGHEELRRYFDHMDKTLDLSKDTYFNTIVEGAHYNTEEGKWKVKSANGQTATCTYLVMATGSTHKANYLKFQDLDKYKGVLVHSSRYPQDLNVSGKKVCVIGSGATGLQIVQTLAREDCQLTACVRTPNFSLPMRQRYLTAEEQDTAKSYYPAWLHAARASKGGFPYDNAKGFFDATPKERQELYVLLWSRGGFNYVGGNYIEMLFNKDANREIYKFWAEKTRKRVQDPIKRDIIAPLEQPYWFATKQPSLEQDYYEMLDRDNVKLIGLKNNPIDRFTANGIRFGGQEGFDADFDIIILATGFDAITGTLVDSGIVGADGISLQKRWSEAPTALSNAPPAIEVQIDGIVDAIKAMREQDIASITADPAAAAKWRARIHEVFNMTLYPETDSWWNGANVDGKLKEPVLFMEGLDTYDTVIKDALNGWQGFQTVKA